MLDKRTYEHVVALVQQRTGVAELHEVEKAIAATLEVLGNYTPDPYRVADWLPAPLCGFFLRGAHEEMRCQDTASLRPFYERVGALLRAPLSAAVEHAVVVCGALAESLDRDSLGILVRHVPPKIASLFETAERAPAELAFLHTRPTSIAEGRPGSSHPLSESRPHREQSHAVIEEENPHAEEKVSSGHPSSDDDESNLAGGKPGAEHPLSEGRR